MPEKISFAFGGKPEAAIEWLKVKKVSTENYRHLTPSEIAKVYTIARISDLDMLNDIKQGMIRAAENGQSLHSWKKELLNHLAAKGWLHPNGHNGKEITDPNTGEIFGTPRRLDNIYRTNMQSAYSAAQYQSYMGNIDNRPYWRYEAIGDERTRAAHAAMDGLVYRYDDPFWATFYPPNGYRCRCSVTALSERDIQREHIAVSVSGEDNLIETEKTYNRKGDTFTTRAFVAPDGSRITTDRGFDYNAGRMNYRPDLDRYDRALAHEFAKAEMKGAEFRAAFNRIESDQAHIRQRLGIGEPNVEQKIQLQHMMSHRLRFAAGVLSEEVRQLAAYQTATVWLSDDTLNKQFASRAKNKAPFDLTFYERLPDILHNPDYVVRNDKDDWFIQISDGKVLIAVLKYLDDLGELFVVSYREGQQKSLMKMLLERDFVYQSYKKK